MLHTRTSVSISAKAASGILFQQGNTRAGVAIMERAVATDSSSVSSQIALATMYISTGEPSKARAPLEAVLGLAPGHPQAKQMLSQLDGTN